MPYKTSSLHHNISLHGWDGDVVYMDAACLPLCSVAKWVNPYKKDMVMTYSTCAVSH